MADYEPEWDNTTFDITITEGEARTIYGALSAYYHSMLYIRGLILEGQHPDYQDKDPTPEQMAAMRRAINRTAKTINRIKNLYCE